jgi:hypothetical protein
MKINAHSVISELKKQHKQTTFDNVKIDKSIIY